MKKLIKPASLLLYFLTTLIFFLAGVLYASKAGVGKGQGLGGVADVFEYGFMFAFFAFFASLIIVYFAKREVIVKTNYLLGIGMAAVFLFFTLRRIFLEDKAVPEKKLPKKTTAPAKPISKKISSGVFQGKTTAPAVFIPKRISSEVSQMRRENKDTPMGLGFFKPNFYENPVLYFYGNPNLEKSLQEHLPADSVVFKRLEHGGFDITYAPPWLVPDHLKLDYDMLYFRVQSIGRDFIEITSNKLTQRIAYVSRSAGKVIYWPDFLLSINTVEFIEGKQQVIRYKPFHHAGEVNTEFQFMNPIFIKNNWMLVLLVDDNYRTVGKGWIQWKKDGKLLITYSLLS